MVIAKMKIVSLVPSATEILCALGLAEQIAGISHDCNFPDEILDRPRLTRTTLAPDLSSYQIDQSVRASAASGYSLYAVETEQLKSLGPDLIVTQEQCRVCAVDRNQTICALETIGVKAEILSLVASDFSELYADIAAVGSVTGRKAQSENLVSELRRRVDSVLKQTSSLQRPRVFCLSWFDPLMVAGKLIIQMVETAGGQACFKHCNKASTRLEIQLVERESPEVIFLLPCSFSQEQAAREWTQMRESSPWRDLPAVRAGRVYALESSLFHRAGPRLIEGIELLAAFIHPACFRFAAANDFSRKVA
jgi:iron complex transport system substrate-binding protein